MVCYKELLQSIEEQNNKLKEVALDKTNSVLYERDNLICKLIELSKPPLYIKEKMVDYKILLLYYIKNFNSEIKVNVSNLDFSVRNETNNFFHLLDIHNKSKFIKENEVHEKIIYNVVKFGDFNRSKARFISKVASFGWIQETLTNPDIIYAKEANISKNFRFDYLFVREVGLGTKTQPYMYHLVGVVNSSGKSKRKIYKINSQFPIEKDKNLSHGDNKVSRLHEYILCKEFLFKRNDIEIPKCPKQNKNTTVEKLNKWNDNF